MKTRFGVLDTSYLSQKHKRAILKEQQIIHNAIDSVPIENYIYDVNNDPEILDMGEKEYAYGVLIDFTKGHSDEDPGFITRIGNMDFHRTLPCHKGRGVERPSRRRTGMVRLRHARGRNGRQQEEAA